AYGTSKTCSRCGYYNKDLRGASIFKCPNCGLIIDRQKNAIKTYGTNSLVCGESWVPPERS
ncbi:MAG: zinc ribbon domain-containing protein, partial [Candidatus Aenigmatarchaeota archaeon]